MTLLGKILVFVNMAFSLLMAAWAFGLYSGRIDWSNKPGSAKDGIPPGELVGKIALIRKAWDGIPPADAAWRRTQPLVKQLEDGSADKKYSSRQDEHAWFDSELQHLRSGATAANPSRIAEFDPVKGTFIPDPANFNRPRMKPLQERSGKPLLSLDEYNKREAELLAAVAKEQTRLDDNIKEDTRLTSLLIGPRGLQQRLKDEKIKKLDLLKEHEIIKPQLINNYVDAELILKRRRSLEMRLEELKKKTLAVAQ